MISDQNYLNWHKKLTENIFFRWLLIIGGLYTILPIYIVGIYLLAAGRNQEVLLTVAAFILARLIINPLVYLVYKQQRPYQKLNFTPPHSVWLFSALTTKLNSFPSDHAASFASIATVIFWFFPWLGALLIVLMIFNAIARVMLGYHHVKDIFAGWLVGLAAGIIALYLVRPIW